MKGEDKLGSMSKIETRLQKVEDRIFLTEQLPLRIGKAVANELSQVSLNVTQATWWQVIEIDLTKVRDRQLYGTYHEKPDCIVYLPDSTGTGTLYLNGPSSHGFAFGTIFSKIRGEFTELYVTNAAQTNLKMNLVLARGDITIEDYIAQPTDIQSQYKPIIASTTTILNAAQVYTSEWYDAVNFGKVILISASDVVSGINGVEIQQSSDGVNADYSTKYTASALVIGGVTRYITVAEIVLVGRYVRCLYTNGGANQTYFRLAARAKVI